MPTVGGLNHVEVYVSDLDRSKAFWGWFLSSLGWSKFQDWPAGISWKLGETYLVLVQAEKKHRDVPYHRCRPGLNHLAFHAASREHGDEMTAKLRERGVKILYEDRHPHAGGPDYYGVFFEDPDRIKVELVAPDQTLDAQDRSVTVREIATGKGAVCERILRSLPDWFGIESSIVDYVRAVEGMPMWVGEVAGETVGFVALELKNDSVAEVHVMGVQLEHHGHGVGTALLDAAYAYLAERGFEFLVVKTLGPSHKDEGYARTRRFYLARGFRPIEEFQGVWAPGNPCLVMVQAVSPTGAHAGSPKPA
jgi:catechol 2,3-dioxygenase-like lactoylglutathione lyase family enzyme/GNAT superfamily N-acetyltransferase